MSKIIIAVLIGVAAVVFFGTGQHERIRGLIPKDLKKSVSDVFSESPRVETKSDSIIPESSTKSDTKEIEQKIKFTPDIETKLPSNTDRQSLAKFETNTQIPTGFGSLDEQETIKLSNEQQKAARLARELALPQEIKFSTSLAGAALVTGPQLKREEPVVITNAAKTTTAKSSALQQKIVEEQKRAEQISLALFGNVQNPNFVKNAENFNRPANTTTTAKTSQQRNAERLAAALAFNAQVLEAQKKK